MTLAREREKYFSAFVWICVLANVAIDGASVRKLEPRYGSLAGETRLTIYGSGFSADQFSQNDDPAVGNRVYLVGDSGSEFSCPVHKDGSTENQIMCYTPNGLSEENYYVKVVVENQKVTDNNLCGGNPTSTSCTHKPRASHTPSIKTFAPSSGMPGTFISMTGKLFSDRYGSNIDVATNGKTEKLLRVYVGPQDCGLKNGDDFYDLSLNGDSSNDGTLACKHKGSSVGFYNASFIIESPYGRSLPDSSVYRVSYNDQIYMFQTYTNITSISQSTGSTAGGLSLTIYGNYFDNRAPYVEPRAYVGDTECEITNVVRDQYVECTVAADPQYSGSTFAGNRGVNFEYWTSTSKTSGDFDNIRTMSGSDPNYVSSWLDDTYHYDNDDMDDYASKMTTYFNPPHTGSYQFMLKADDGARLYVDGSAVVTSTRSWESSALMSLTAGQSYLLEVAHYENGGDSFVHLKAKYFNTSFTSAWTSKAVQERQVIGVTSTVTYDVQSLEFASFGNVTATKEVQTVTVETPGEFRFGLFGVYTKALTQDVDEATVLSAVQSLPVWGSGESVLVTREQQATPTFVFTFDSNRGDFPLIDVVKVSNSSDVTYTVTKTTQGVPNRDTAALTLQGVTSTPFSVSSLTADVLKSAIKEMFTARCPSVFEGPGLSSHYTSFESNSALFEGSRVYDTEPFCGTYVLKNPWRIYKQKQKELGIMLSAYGTVCFAYKGHLKNFIGVTYTLKQASDSETVTKTDYFPYTFKTDGSDESTAWYYACENVYSLVYDKYPADTEHRLREVFVYNANSQQDAYIDSLFIGRTTTTDDPEIHLRRLPPSRPNRALIKDVSVTSISASKYEVTLVPFDCGYNLPLFELAHATVSSGSVESNAVSMTLDNSGGSGILRVARSSTASPPVTGFIDITFKGNTRTGLNVSLESAQFDRELESLSGIGALEVTKEGDCANFDLGVTFLTLPGDQPEMTVTYGQLAGTDAAGSISTEVDGGLFYNPLTGDMLSTVHTNSQVRLYMNDVPTTCDGDCSFTWASGSTPTVTGVSPTSGTSALSTSIVISGTGFSTNKTENTVTIADVACTVTAATATSVTCSVGNGPVGAYPVMVNVAGKGNAAITGTVEFTYTADTTGISPSSGSLGGGVTLTISGFGFKQGASVAIGSKQCKVLSVQTDQIQCIVPASSASVSDVEIVQGSTTLTYSSFTYDAALTATVSSINPASLTVQGGSLSISGSGFGLSQGAVYLGDDEVTVSSWTDTAISVDVVPTEAGDLTLSIRTSNGLAVDSNNLVPTVAVDLSVTNVYPTQGSLQGGTKLTVTGTGFGSNSSLVDISVGDFDCEVENLANTKVVCKIGNAGSVHEITNLGTDPAYGVYYAYDPPFVTINVGDFVHWKWETPEFVNNIAHAIIEVDSPSSTSPKVGGFSSGTPSKDGEFRYQFTETGTYYVWSGFVDEWGIKNYAGTIEVVTASSSSGEITVSVSGIEATYDVGGASDPVDSSACQSTVSSKAACSDPAPQGSDPAKFNFAFWTCSTPVVTGVDVHNGTAQTTITLTGEGFSGTDCQNEVSFGGYACEATASSDTEVSCKMSKADEPELGILHLVGMRVGNRGNALISIMEAEDRGFGLLPSVESITPVSGSMAGGNRLTITGFGFGDSPAVDIGGYPCSIVESSYIEIICETPASNTQAQKDVTVNAYIGANPLPAECETSTRTCKYSYAHLWTPEMGSVSPSSMSSTTVFNITGSGFGTDTGILEVFFGSARATVTDAQDSFLLASVDNIPAGNNAVTVRVVGKGKALGSLTVTGTPTITSVTPSSGSIHGQTTITILGNGFVENDTSVSLGGSACEIMSTTLGEVVCVTSAHAAGSASVDITSNSVTYTPNSFNYDTGASPTITAVSPVSGLPGSTLTISGSNFANSGVTVTLDGVDCDITSSSATQIQCTLGNHATGSVPVSAYVDGKGASNTDVTFEYQLSLTNINPITGGTAGGQSVTLTGTGFTDAATATICGNACQQLSSTVTELVCKTPANTAQTCDVVISLNGLSKTLATAYTYDAALTPSITGVSPRRGGTGGGTSITITGSGFGTNQGAVSVEIDGVACVPSNVVDTEILCQTGPHLGSVDATVEVQVSGNGIAQEGSAGDAVFSYIDVWSSPYTWGGGPVPQAGEFIIIPAGMTLLLDIDTPVLSFLLIQGGTLIFDEKDVELQSNIIMITDGGVLQVGTETQPFQHKGIITLHGHHRSRELPIYGTKVLAVRNGTLDLHGIEVPITWTRLQSTANVGDNTLSLMDPVEWNVGDEIVIAASGHHHTQSQNEKHTISAVSMDKRTLTLSERLEAKHWGTQETFDGTLVEFRAEVGLLTHNVVVRGNQDPQWEDEIKACAKGFNTGEFATQTCFLGRFGDEIGSSQFGAMILVHAPVFDTHEAQARISYTEITFAGQAFRLGRYPVHFHLNGDMSTSYVRGCGIHKTFNRAVNIHGTHNTMVEKTVIYDIMGGAFFLEDGIETGNTLQYNLAVFVRESSSLLNDDITPASFWVTNPNNTVQHNAAAGGTHFGYWYRMHNHPDGPSFTSSVCPKNVPLGVFYNNSAHSFGWFGLWIFEDYFPLQGGCGGSQVEPAVFEKLFAWNNDKGAEAVNSGALQFKDFTLVQNKLAGYEGKKVLNVPLWQDNSPMIRDSLIVGKTTVIPESVQGCTFGGIVFPYGRGFRVINVRFVNFAESGCATFSFARIAGTCSLFCGGYTYHTEAIKFVNAPNKCRYAWDWEGIILDKDGTLTGKTANWTILPTTGTVPNDCEAAPEFSVGQAASMCPSQYKWHRFAFNNVLPESLEGKDFIVTNGYGNSSVPFAKKRLSHKPGWMCALLKGATYDFHFENAAQIKNISFTGQFYDFETADYLYMRLAVKELPDRFSIDGGNNFINMSVNLDPATAKNGDWEWDNINDEIRFVVSGRKRSRRGMSTYSLDRPMSFSAFKCFYTDCIPPPDPNTVPPVANRPAAYDYWDDTTLWNMTDDGYFANIDGNAGLPTDGANVYIARDTWVIVNMTQIARLGTLVIEGVLEFYDTPGARYSIEADYIIIKGGRLIIGWPDDPFDGEANITLRGDHSTSYFDAGDGPTVGAKAIGVFGGLDLFGKDVGRTWTQLANTAEAGSRTIVLKDGVNWEAGDSIVLGPTSFNVWETESFEIQSVAADNVTLTLNDTLRYKHVVHSETLTSGHVIDVGAAVGLLTRNIKIIGADYDKLYKQSFGARVLVGLVTSQGQTYGGYARLSNVEFYHTGQEGFTEEYDPRFSVAYVATGTVNHVKPSKVTKCSFHNGFNTAIGAFGIGSLEISDNVVFGSIGNGIATSSNDTRLLNNLVALMVATNSYQDRFETFNPRWEAGIEAMDATELVMEDNLVTGSERIAYHVQPVPCSGVSKFRNNKAYANVIGVVVVPEDSVREQCAKFNGFTVWKSHDYGMYYQNANFDFVADDNVLIENGNGFIGFMVGPSALGHAYANKSITVSNSLFVGQTSSFDCSIDVLPSNDDNVELSGNARPSRPAGGGMVGVVFSNFYQGSNKAPGKPWKGCMAYNAIGGRTYLIGNTFAKYDSQACDNNYAISTNVGNDDGQHPLESHASKLVEVDHTKKIFYHRPNVGKINSADCVDMDCDALKKALFKDMDGTFLGHVGSVIPHSEFQWNGDPRRGLGDYRIPKEMVTKLDGTRIPYDTMMPNKGIIRNENCTYQSSWQAYECMDDINYEMLIIESMDGDTETRRLSPVAILGNGYIDLINGPQDHGWCSGYTCRKRISTFMALVATDEEYLMHFTSTTPEHMRYRMLNVAPDAVIKLTVWYSRPNRLDVFADDQYVMATNARTVNGRYVIDMPKGNEFEPHIDNATGTNYFDKDRGELTMIIKGAQKIDVVSRDTIIVSFGLPAMTVADFFGDNMVEHLAAFLNIPLTKVRIVNVVSAAGSSSGRRKKRSTGISVEVEIGDEPSNGINDTVSNPVSYDDLFTIASNIVNECQVGNVSETLNITGACESVVVPSSDPIIGSIVYSTPSPDYLYFHEDALSEYEGVPLKKQPLLRAADAMDMVVTELGTTEYPWVLSVSIREGSGHPNAQLVGVTNVTVVNGWFNFTDLVISHMGSSYILDFNVTYPPEAENFTVSTLPFDVAGRPVKINLADRTSGDLVQSSMFYMQLDLCDEVTSETITDISWRDHTWYAEAGLLMSSPYGDLTGVLTSTFDPTSGQALFPDLIMTGFGVYYLQFRVYSDPPDFNMTLNHKLEIVNPSHIGMVIEDTYEIKVKFDLVYSTVLPDTDSENMFEQMFLTEMANVWPDVKLSVGSIYEGSIAVTFVVSGSTVNVNSTAYSLCDSISNGTTYSFNGNIMSLSPFMTINNQTYYGVVCGEMSDDDDDDDGMKPYLIAIIVILSILVVIAVVGLLVWRLSIKPKTRTHVPITVVAPTGYGKTSAAAVQGTLYMGQSSDVVESYLFREDTFTSMKFNLKDKVAAPPIATKITVPGFSQNEYMTSPRFGGPTIFNKPEAPPAYSQSADPPVSTGYNDYHVPRLANSLETPRLDANMLTARGIDISDESPRDSPRVPSPTPRQYNVSPAPKTGPTPGNKRILLSARSANHDGSSSGTQSRPHSPFVPCESPMAPVGDNELDF